MPQISNISISNTNPETNNNPAQKQDHLRGFGEVAHLAQALLENPNLQNGVGPVHRINEGENPPAGLDAVEIQVATAKTMYVAATRLTPRFVSVLWNMGKGNLVNQKFHGGPVYLPTGIAGLVGGSDPIAEEVLDPNEEHLYTVETHRDLYESNQTGVNAQRAYLRQHAQNSNQLNRFSEEALDSQWNEIELDEESKLVVGNMYEGAKAAELTDYSAALSSKNAGSSLIGYAKAVIYDVAARRDRTFGSVIQVDPSDIGLDSIDIVHGYESVIKPLYLALKAQHSDIHNFELHLHGSSDDNNTPESLRLAAATVHAALSLSIDLKSCLLPMNNSNQVVASIMYEDGISFAQKNL